MIALASARVMVAANVGSAVGDLVAMLLRAWPPFIALACWFVLVHVRRAPAHVQPDHETTPEPECELESETPAEPVTLRPARQRGGHLSVLV